MGKAYSNIKINKPKKNNEIGTLAGATAGQYYRIVKILGGHQLRSRLCAMGLLPGENFRVYSSSKGGPFCISIKGSRFALGRGIIDRIIIQENG